MRKSIRIIFSWLLCAFILVQSIQPPDSAFAAAAEKSITILFTHDLHDNLLPFKTLENGNITYYGGYARLKSVINTEKEIDPEALLVDAGDYSMGTPFQTIYKSDAPELRILGRMGYDAVTFGNHEFDYRAEGLAESLNTAKASKDKLPQIVQSNISYPTDKGGSLTPTLSELKQAMESYGVKDYIILERNGVKIGIFGVMGADSASKAPMSEAQFTDEVGNAKRVVKILKEQEKVDLIVCLSHSGTWTKKSESEDEILAKKVPDIDVIISGHTHTELQNPIIVGNTVIGSCGDYGKYLGVIKITQKDEGTWGLDQYSLDPVVESLPEDQEIDGMISDFKNTVQEKYFAAFGMQYDEAVANSPYNFQTLEDLTARHDESALGNLISDAYIYAADKALREAEGDNYEPVAAAIVPNGTIRGTITQGDITAADAFSISSLGIGKDQIPGYPLISVYLTGKELKTVCEVDASIAPIMSDAQLYMSGVNFTFNPNRMIFNKVTDTGIANLNPAKPYEAATDSALQKIDDKKLYRIVAGLYSAQMLSVVGDKSFGLMSVVPKTKDGTPITNFEDEIIYDTESGSKRELKEWYALVEYLKSFDQENGVSVIPAYYNETHDRKVSDDSKDFVSVFEKPNHIAVAVYLIIAAAVAVIILIFVRIFRRKKHKKQKAKEIK